MEQEKEIDIDQKNQSMDKEFKWSCDIWWI